MWASTRRSFFLSLLSLLSLLTIVYPAVTPAAEVANPICPQEHVTFDPGNGEDIVVPEGYTISVFAKGLNSPTGIAFRGNRRHFEVYVLESGHGLPSICNEQGSWPGGTFASDNPFTPDIVVFDESGNRLRGPIGKPTASGDGFQPAGPAIDIAFENGLAGGRLFATDSNQATHGGGQNNSSRIIIVDPGTGHVTPFITGLPTGDHPAEQLAFDDGWVYWSQESTTNSGVVGLDDNGGLNQHDIPCQDITLSGNTFNSGGGHATSGYSPWGTIRPAGTVVPAFASALHPGVCDGAVLRARIKRRGQGGRDERDPANTIEPFSWGYRNPYGIRFAPKHHALSGGLFVTENGEDERGARPVNNAPDRLALARQNADGSPDYHGWPDRFGFLDSTQAVFNPVGGPGDDLCTPPPGGFSAPFPACIPQVIAHAPAGDVPVEPVLLVPPQQITAPLALEPADVAVVGTDFVPDSFVQGPVGRGARGTGR